MNETAAATEDLHVGSDRQHNYALRLLPKSPFSTLREVATHLGLCEAEEATLPAQKASTLITHLKGYLALEPGKETPAPAPTRHALTPTQLRRLVEHQISDPPAMDADTAWVLQRIRMSHSILIAMSGVIDPALQAAVSFSAGTATLAAMIKRYGTAERVADVLGVAVRTVNSWAGQLPAKYERIAQELLRESTPAKEPAEA